MKFMMKLYPSALAEMTDFLHFVSELAYSLREADSPAEICFVLHQNLFSQLEATHNEFYIVYPGRTTLLPPPAEFRNPSDPFFSHVPHYLELNENHIRQVIKTKKPVIFNDPDVSLPLLSETGNNSHMLTPVFNNGDIHGLLYCGHESPGYFGQEYIHGFTAIAAIIGSRFKTIDEISALHDNILNLERAEKVQTALFEISDAAHNVGSMPELYETMHILVSSMITAKNFYIALTENSDDGTTISFPYYVDEYDSHFQGKRIPLKPGEQRTLTGFMIENGVPLLTGPANFDQVCETHDITFLGSKPTSWLGAPFFNEQVSGAVVVQSYDDIIYSERDKELIVYVARHVGDALSRKKNFDQLKVAKEKAESEKKNKSSFLANMSHEIRTPMNGIIGVTDLLLGTDLNEQQRTYLEMVKTSSDRLLTLVNDILDFSKIEAGKLSIKRSTFRLRDTLAAPLSLLRVQTAQKNIELTTIIEPNVPELLIGDPNHLCQIILNLIGNAIKFTDVGGVRIQVTKDHDAADLEENQVALLFSISDTGIGIPTDQQKKIFNAYEQVETIGNEFYKGTGLGLVVTTQLVELMSGKIWLESTADQGSCFYFKVPFIIPTPMKSSIQPAARSATNLIGNKRKRGLRILLAEDDRISQTIAVAVLESQGWEVTAVVNGQEVLDELDNNYHDLILMDVQMPEMNGFETTRKIRVHSNRKISKIPIIAMTAHAVRGDREKCLAAGMNGYLSKPIETKIFMEVIDKILSNSAPI